MKPITKIAYSSSTRGIMPFQLVTTDNGDPFWMTVTGERNDDSLVQIDLGIGHYHKGTGDLRGATIQRTEIETFLGNHQSLAY